MAEALSLKPQLNRTERKEHREDALTVFVFSAFSVAKQVLLNSLQVYLRKSAQSAFYSILKCGDNTFSALVRQVLATSNGSSSQYAGWKSSIEHASS